MVRLMWWARKHQHGYWQYNNKERQIYCIACGSVFKLRFFKG